MRNKVDEVANVTKILRAYSPRDSVEILANVISTLGIELMDSEGANLPESITPDIVADLVLKDVKARGETLGNALARQGLTMMIWLEQD